MAFFILFLGTAISAIFILGIYAIRKSGKEAERSVPIGDKGILAYGVLALVFSALLLAVAAKEASEIDAKLERIPPDSSSQQQVINDK